MTKTKVQTGSRPHAIYARLSKAPDGELEKVESQIANCKRYATSNGLPISDDQIYYDNSLSAWKRGVRRPEWDRLMEAAESGAIAGILVWAVDRFTRRPKDLEALIDLSEQNALTIEGPRSGRLDLTTASGKQQARWMALQAASESDNTSERVRATFDRRRRGGQPTGGMLYGFAANRQDQVPEEVAVIRSLAQRLLEGESTVALADWLNSNGITTQRGSQWRPAHIGRMLQSPRMGGLIVDDQGEVIARVKNSDGTPQDPVLDRDTFDQVQALLMSRRRGRRPTDRYPLSGAPVCGDCGRRMTGATVYRHGGSHRSYECNRTNSGCGRAVDAALVESQVADYMITKVLNDPENAATIARNTERLSDERSGLQQQLDAIDRQLTDLEFKLAAGDVIQQAYDAAQPKLMARRAKLTEGLAELAPTAAAAIRFDADANWRLVAPDEQRQLLKVYGVQIVIGEFISRFRPPDERIQISHS